MLCQFKVYRKVIQLYAYICIYLCTSILFQVLNKVIQLYTYIHVYLCISILFFFSPQTQHVEVPGPGIKPVPQLQSKPQFQQCQILNQLSHKGTFHLFVFRFFSIIGCYRRSRIRFNLTECGRILSQMSFKFSDTCLVFIAFIFFFSSESYRYSYLKNNFIKKKLFKE